MGALSGKERPQSADAGTVERAAVVVLAIAVAVIAPPAWAGRQLYLEKRIDHRDGVADARIVRRAQSEAHQREGVGTYDRPSLVMGLAWGTILDRHKAVGWRGGFRRFGRADANIITLDASLPADRRARDIGPALDLIVPDIGGLAQVHGCRLLAHLIGDVGCGEERRDLDSECEGRVAAILLPTVLAGDRTVADDKSRGAKHHRPKPPQLAFTQSPSRHIRSTSSMGKAHSSSCTPVQ